MRLFLAIKIEPSDKYLQTIEALKHKLRFDKISWSKPEMAHLTFKYFGRTPDKRLKQIDKYLQIASKNVEPFQLNINKIGAFGSSYRPSVLWFGVEEEKLLKSVHHKLFFQLKFAGYTPDRGHFVPHITIARIHKTTDKSWFWKSVEEYQTEWIQQVEVKEMHLFNSIDSPRGVIHKLINTYEFSKE